MHVDDMDVGLSDSLCNRRFNINPLRHAWIGNPVGITAREKIKKSVTDSDADAADVFPWNFCIQRLDFWEPFKCRCTFSSPNLTVARDISDLKCGIARRAF